MMLKGPGAGVPCSPSKPNSARRLALDLLKTGKRHVESRRDGVSTMFRLFRLVPSLALVSSNVFKGLGGGRSERAGAGSRVPVVPLTFHNDCPRSNQK